MPQVENHPEDIEDEYSEERVEFGSIMFCCNTEVESRRHEYLFFPETIPPVFHPSLEHFSKMFQHMATYLSIPWKDYMEVEEVKVNQDDSSLMDSMLEDFALPWCQSNAKVEYFVLCS